MRPFSSAALETVSVFIFKLTSKPNHCAVPSLLLQPLVENAIRHGIGLRKQSDLVFCQCLHKSGSPEHRSKKNRASMLDDAPERLLSRGVGLGQPPLRASNVLYGSHQSFAISNLEPQGVAVFLSLPVRPLLLPMEELAVQAVS